jgi:hypothetical protein
MERLEPRELLSGDTPLSSESLGENVALGCSYTLSPAPNYSYCTEPGDATQLTDGVYTKGYFWTQTSTVGWQPPSTVPWAQITIDLGADQPIQGLSFNTAAGVAGVQWPTVIDVLVSTDGANFYDAGEVVRLSVDHGLPPADGYLVRPYWTDRLTTHGRYVKVVVANSPYLFVDEIEVHRGPDEFLSQPYPGDPVTNLTTYIISTRQRAMQVRRIVFDAQDLAAQVNASTHLTADERAELGAQLTGCVQQALYDNPAQITLPVDDLHRQVFAVQAALWRSEGISGLTAWNTASAWDQILPIQTPLSGITPNVDVTTMQGEFRSAAFNLCNPTDADLDVYLRVSGLPGGAQPSWLTVYEAEWIDTKSGVPHLAALPEAAFDTAQNAFLVHVPSGLTRQVWLTFHSAGDVSAGTYTGAILVDGLGAGSAAVPVSWRLSALPFPTQPTLGLGGWDYTNTTYGQVTATNRETLIATLASHYVDTPWATSAVMPSSLDFTQFDAWVARWPQARQYRVFLSVSSTFAGYAMGSAEFNAAVGAWISAYAAHWRQMSPAIAANQVGVLLVDEPHTAEQSERIIAWANAITAAEPDVLIWEDPTFTNAADGAALYDVCDVLCPNRPRFLSGTEAYRDVYRAERDAGATLNFYSCSGPTEKLDPYSYYRLQAWTCWEEWGRVNDASTAMFYWAFSDQGGAASWRTSYPVRENYTPLFLDPTGVTQGKDMEAIREGIEDYEYLHLLKTRIAELESQGVPAAVLSEATDLLRAAPQSVLNATGAGNLAWNQAKDRTVADTVRGQVLDLLEQLAPVSASTNLDADGNGTADALTDGILILRYLFDPTGPWDCSDALGSDATRTTRADIKGFLDGGQITLLDVDGNGTADALTDGILILRYLFDPAGAWNCSDALGSAATRTTRAQIKAHLDAYRPSLALSAPSTLAITVQDAPSPETPALSAATVSVPSASSPAARSCSADSPAVDSRADAAAPPAALPAAAGQAAHVLARDALFRRWRLVAARHQTARCQTTEWADLDATFASTGRLPNEMIPVDFLEGEKGKLDTAPSCDNTPPWRVVEVDHP